jgi:hypothetical protein
MSYVIDLAIFLKNSFQCPNLLQTMQETKRSSVELWKYSKETKNMDKLNKRSAELAVQDQINWNFTNQLIKFEEEKLAILENKEELPEEMDKPIPPDLINMEDNAPQRLFNPFLELKGFHFLIL